MSESMTDDTLSYEDIGHLLEAKGKKLADEPENPDKIIREVLETLGRAETVRFRDRKVDGSGRVSVGRDVSNRRGAVLFQLDETVEGGEDE